MNPKLVQLSSGDWIIPAQVIRIQVSRHDIWKSVENCYRYDFHVKVVFGHGETVSVVFSGDRAGAEALRDEVARLRNGE